MPHIDPWFLSMNRSVANYLFTALGISAQKRNSKTHRPSGKATCTYEAYEPRRLLANVSFDAGQVVIGGSDAIDTARVVQVSDTIVVSHQGETHNFAVSAVDSILFVGLGGDDFFENTTSIFAHAVGQAGNDTLIGGSGADRLIGNGGNDTITGNSGDDFILAGNGDDTVDAGAGNDRVIGVRGFNNIEAGTGNDEIFGGLETDIITAISGTNTLVGSSGDDVVTGGSGDDLIFGGLGEDFIRGVSGNDRIYAQGGNDTLSGGSGFDIVSGNDGDDVLQGEQGNDRIVGGNGTDRVNFSGSLIDNYSVTGTTNTALFINDLRGPNFGLQDTVLTVEEYSFADGTFDAAQTLNPVVNPPNTNVREVVYIQPIVVSNSDGSNEAEFFGTAAQEADIKNRIDEIFGQADIDIEFLTTREINDTFINVGTGSGTRTSGDLDRIISNGDSRGVGNPDANVIDLYFVERVPGFAEIGDNVANGLAFVGAAGAAVHVGDNLVDFSAGRQTVAEVTAHEIGHNLGLSHNNTANNLLASSGGGSDLDSGQINTILTSRLSQPSTTSGTLIEVELPGDLKLEGAVSNDDVKSDTEISGGCGGCGVCGPCLSLVSLG